MSRTEPQPALDAAISLGLRFGREWRRAIDVHRVPTAMISILQRMHQTVPWYLGSPPATIVHLKTFFVGRRDQKKLLL